MELPPYDKIVEQVIPRKICLFDLYWIMIPFWCVEYRRRGHVSQYNLKLSAVNCGESSIHRE
jgi:hypothetical protein